MKKVILLVEDQQEEQEKAKSVLANAGYRVAVADNLRDAMRLCSKLENVLSGVITDLHFPEGMHVGNKNDDGKNPCGLAIVTWALIHDVPVAVCSDIDHHFCLYLKELMANLGKLTGKHVPFTMDSKNWRDALKSLEQITEGKTI